MLLTNLARAFAAALFLSASALAQNLVFEEDFASGLAGWNAGNWHAQSATDTCGALAAPFPNGPGVAYMGTPGVCNYVAAPQANLNRTIALPSGQRGTLRCWMFMETEGGCAGWDVADIHLGGQLLWYNCGQPPQYTWFLLEFDVTHLLGLSLPLRFSFRAGDDFDNDGLGWMIDRIEVEVEPYATPCAGDGTGIACPCGNSGAPGHGCANSFFADGALLSVTGLADRSSDSVVLHATNVTNASGTYFQGTTVESSTSFDGILCVGGNLIRLGSKIGVGNASRYPEAGDASVSVRGQVPPAGGTFYYTMRYRNAAAAFCPPETANFSNAVRITWRP